MTAILIERSGPLVTVQDAPRQGMRAMGLAPSGPMDASSFALAGRLAGSTASAGIECSSAGFSFVLKDGATVMGCAGGDFSLSINGRVRPWPSATQLADEDRIEIGPAQGGNWGYVRFTSEIALAPVLGSRSTHVAVGIGGLEGRSLQAGDRIGLIAADPVRQQATEDVAEKEDRAEESVFQIVWGLHASMLSPERRAAFLASDFRLSSRMDRMGTQLVDAKGVFSNLDGHALVSDAAVPGDIQILGDGTPVVLMRESQPTAGYPRIATLLSGSLDRFAQMAPGSRVRFRPITVEQAHKLIWERGP